MGKNLNGDVVINNEYSIEEVLAEGSGYSDAIKDLARIAQKVAKISNTKNYTTFKVSYPGDNSKYANDLIWQYFSIKDMKDAGNSYKTFTENNPYWTIVDGIPTWAR